MTKKIIIKKILKEDECQELLALCLLKIKYIRSLENDSEWDDVNHLLASRHKYYNIFNFVEFNFLLDKIKRNLSKELIGSKEYGIKGWVNYLEPFESLPIHYHDHELSGHVTISAESGDTIYYINDKTVPVKPVNGNLHLLERGIPHSVSENFSTEPRVSIAFDVIKYKEIEKEDWHLLKQIKF